MDLRRSDTKSERLRLDPLRGSQSVLLFSALFSTLAYAIARFRSQPRNVRVTKVTLPCHAILNRMGGRSTGVSDERQAYTPGDARYITTSKRSPLAQRTNIRAEQRIGTLIAGCGVIWTAHVAMVDYASLWQLRLLPPGPVEVCTIGFLIWLHAKWRRAKRA